MKTVIIGGVVGGATAAARLRRLDEKAEIIILERGEYVSFANCGLPYYIGGVITDREDLTLQTPESFKARFNIDVRVLNEAVKINPDTKTVTVKNLRTGETYEETYDNLILSVGAEPIRPNIEGADGSNVFTLRNIPDTLKIKNYIDTAKPRSAVVIGGGYIGIEMAENLVEAGLKVAIVELADHLIAPLDFDMAADVHRYIKSKGVDLHLNNGVKAINGNTVILQNGEITADMIILSVGVRPETAIAKDCGIELNPRGSIVVNNKMQTNIPDIYAVGDAVEVEDFITKKPAFIPLAGPANKQGRIAADNIAGCESVYTGTQGSAVLKLFDMTVATTGLNEKSATAAGVDYDKIYTYSASHATYYPGAAQMSIKALWDKKTLKLIGAQIVGFDGVDKRMDVKTLSATIGHVSAATTLDIYSHMTDTMQMQAAVSIDRKIGGTNAQMPVAEQTPEETAKPPVNAPCAPADPLPEPEPRKIRKSGTGCLYQINDNLWEGSFFPRLPNGKRKKFNVYAETKEQCEIKLAEMIERVKAEVAEEKAKLKEGDS